MDLVVVLVKLILGGLVLAVGAVVAFEVAELVLRDWRPRRPAHDEYLDYLRADTELGDLAQAGREAVLKRWLEDRG